MNKVKEVISNTWTFLENVVLRLGTYEDLIRGFISKNPRTTMWIWLGTIYLTWRLS